MTRTESSHRQFLGVRPNVRERVRRAIVSCQRTGDRPTNRRVRAVAECSANDLATIMRAYRAGEAPALEDVAGWGEVVDEVHYRGRTPGPKVASDDISEAAGSGAGEATELEAMVRDAKTDEARAAAALEIAARVGRPNGLPHQVAKVMLDGLRVSSAQSKEHRQQDGGNVRVDYLLCTPEARLLVEAFESLVSERRREQLLEYVIAEVAADMREHPSVGERDG